MTDTTDIPALAEEEATPPPPQPPDHRKPGRPQKPPSSSSTAVQERPAPTRTPRKTLPHWRVLLHNDDLNEFEYVIRTVHLLTPLNVQDAAQRTLEAHEKGLALLIHTHQERAELYVQQFRSKGLVVTIEPAD